MCVLFFLCFDPDDSGRVDGIAVVAPECWLQEFPGIVAEAVQLDLAEVGLGWLQHPVDGSTKDISPLVSLCTVMSFSSFIHFTLGIYLSHVLGLASPTGASATFLGSRCSDEQRKDIMKEWESIRQTSNNKPHATIVCIACHHAYNHMNQPLVCMYLQQPKMAPCMGLRMVRSLRIEASKRTFDPRKILPSEERVMLPEDLWQNGTVEDLSQWCLGWHGQFWTFGGNMAIPCSLSDSWWIKFLYSSFEKHEKLNSSLLDCFITGTCRLEERRNRK